MQMLLNFAVFQVGWFSSVLGAAREMPWLGPLVFLAIVLFHLRQARRPDLEAGLVIACGVIGTWFDSFLVAAGWVVYPSGQLSTLVAPYWIVTMWMLFATTLNRSLGWLRGRDALAVLLGAAAGPASYWAGRELGAIEFRDPVVATGVLAIGWAALMPVLMRLAERLDGFRDVAVGDSR